MKNQRVVRINGYNIKAVNNVDIVPGDLWVYIDPLNGVDYGDDNNPIIESALPSSWFDRLHDKKNYFKVVESDNPKHNLPNCNQNKDQ